MQASGLVPWWIVFRRVHCIYIHSMILNFTLCNFREAVRYCYTDLVRTVLDEFVEHWNYHYVRKSGRNTLGGKPELMYIQCNV